MPLWRAHDIAQDLQDQVEKLPDVDRCFVHIDHETDHKPVSNRVYLISVAHGTDIDLYAQYRNIDVTCDPREVLATIPFSAQGVMLVLNVYNRDL